MGVYKENALDNQKDESKSGVVTSTSGKAISVSFEEDFNSDDSRNTLDSYESSFMLIKLANDVTYKRLKR